MGHGFHCELLVITRLGHRVTIKKTIGFGSVTRGRIQGAICCDGSSSVVQLGSADDSDGSTAAWSTERSTAFSSLEKGKDTPKIYECLCESMWIGIIMEYIIIY